MADISRRSALMGAGALLATKRSTLAASFDWQPIAPAEAGFAPDIEARLDKLVADKRAWNLHGVVVVRC
jgi:hypothetical protein